MRQNTWLKPTMCLVVSLLLVLVVVVAATPTATLAGEAKVQRLIFVSAGFNEGNRHAAARGNRSDGWILAECGRGESHR